MKYSPLLLLAIALGIVSCATPEEQKPKEAYSGKIIYFEIGPEFDYSGLEYDPVEITVQLSAGFTEYSTSAVTTLLDTTFQGPARGFKEMVPNLLIQRIDSLNPDKAYAWYRYSVGKYHTGMFLHNGHTKYKMVDESEKEVLVEVAY